jgi:very-long-chain ceramide synthase
LARKDSSRSLSTSVYLLPSFSPSRNTFLQPDMDIASVPAWIPSFLVPFVTLSYPTTAPANPDSFPDSSYYGTGYLDLCTVVGHIAVMAVLRHIARLYVFEPFARWWLSENLKNIKKARYLRDANRNGTVNGHSIETEHTCQQSKKEERQMNRSVMRVAEQGWAYACYTIQFAFGTVSRSFS